MYGCVYVDVNVKVNVADENAGGGRRFDHERLDACQVALEFAAWIRELLRALPRGNGDLADQLKRAASSVVLNIAEGGGEFSTADRARFFRMARRSALECAAVLDLVEMLGAVSRSCLDDGRGLLRRVVAMLSVLTRPHRTGTS